MILKKAAYTLVEILVVIGIILVMALVVLTIVNPRLQRNRANDSVVKKSVSDVSGMIEVFKASVGRYPAVADSNLLKPYINPSFAIATTATLISFSNPGVDNGTAAKKIYWDPAASCLQSVLNEKTGAAKTYVYWTPSTKVQVGTAGCSAAIAGAP